MEKRSTSTVPAPLKPHTVKAPSTAAQPPISDRFESKDSSEQSERIERKGLTERSIFHEPWWLNATAGDNWHVAVVKSGDAIIAEMPYTLIKGGRLWRVSYLPAITRTLGPVIKARAKGSSHSEWRHRLDVTRKLIEQLPECAHFQQLADPRVSDAEAAAFMLAGFNVSVRFTLRLAPGANEDYDWARLDYKTRNRVRRAAEHFTVEEIANVDAFVDFYESNLAARDRGNHYGSGLMRHLLNEVMTRKAGMIIGAFDEDGSLVAATTLVWDRSHVYYLLTSRLESAHGGAVSLLVWRAMAIARDRQLELDFDGVATAGILQFLAGFGGRLVQRYEFEKIRPDYAIFRRLRTQMRPRAKARSE
ncbi:GNAT family N-acetyltransferase [Caballeronia sp. Lep1P3]|uniref:GNAT family N-acetyltransferase n=1 Tax=Caballeronia sp. Lep1P3 TaxID=2878150 RepID=UPI001FD5F8AD|nr:GNAT family N-acetyltransferase [Caballeronia sp. Lep1P3]